MQQLGEIVNPESLSHISDDLERVVTWCDNQYQDNFAEYFEDVRNLYRRLQSDNNPITDSELEQILIEVPLQLFAVSEQLNQFNAKIELLKLQIRKTQYESMQSSTQTSKEDMKLEASYNCIEEEMLLKEFKTVVDRVEREISFSRELIMSAKKIWTARKSTESLASGVDTLSLPQDDLPEFQGKSYIQ